MDSIRITDLQMVNEYQPRDKMGLQRFDAGVWNDYYTELGDYLGQYTTRVYEWNMSLALGESISPVTPGNYLVLIDAWYVYDPGASFTGSPVQLVMGSTTSGWGYTADFPHASTGRAGMITPSVPDGGTNAYGGVGGDLLLSSGFTASHGTCRIYVRYVEVTPL